MSKLRLLFTKEAQASYISHLDTMRTFQRVFPRAGLSLRHSNGFHPHPIISILLPLPVGQASDCEMLSFETVEDSDGKGVAEALNTGLPMGLRVKECYVETRPARDFAYLASSVTLEYDGGIPEGCLPALEKLFAQEEIIVEKRTKHKEIAEIDIQPLLHEIKIATKDDSICCHVIASAQNPGLNPALIAQAVARYLPQYAPSFARVRREEAYDAEMKIFR